MTTPSAARAVARERRDAREPHTLSDVSYLESQPAPRLNNLSGSARANGDATAASSVLQQFSSVSPHHAGFSSANDSGGGGMFFPPFPAPFSFTCPQDVPWIPPPPIPALDTSAHWPSPRDIPLPSSFPFPPFAIPPFAIPPPPPPWGLPQQMAQQQMQQMAQQQMQQQAQQMAQQMAQQQQQAQQMAQQQQQQQDHKLREPRGLRGPPRGPPAARDAPLRQRPARAERSRSCSSSADSCCNAWAQSLRAASPPLRTARGASAQRRATQKSPKRTLEPRLAEQRNYYTAARAVKGSAPCLADELARRRTPLRFRAHSGASAARVDSVPRQAPKDAAARNSTARVGEYLKGIEDLYQRLRESYEEFQRDPSSFVKNAAELKDAALASAPPVQTLFDGAPQPSQSLKPSAPQEQKEPQPSQSLKPSAPQEQKEPQPSQSLKPSAPQEQKESQPQQRSQQPSAESQGLREELMRLEMQWQRLEELKRRCTGERGAGPVEITQTRRGGAAPEGIAVTRELEPRSVGGAMGMASRSSTPGGASHRSRSDSSDGNRQLFTRDRLLGLVRERKAMMD